jgi:hypothetical protein
LAEAVDKVIYDIGDPHRVAEKFDVLCKELERRPGKKLRRAVSEMHHAWAAVKKGTSDRHHCAQTAEYIVSTTEARPVIKGLGAMPVDELSFHAARIRLLQNRNRSLVYKDDSGRRASAEASLLNAAIQRWCARLRTGERGAAPFYADLDDHARELGDGLARLDNDVDGHRNALIDQILSTSMLPRFQLWTAFRTVWLALNWPARLLYALGALLIVAPPWLWLTTVLLAPGSPWWVGLTLLGGLPLLGLASTGLVSIRVGVIAFHPFGLRLAGACFLGTLLVAGVSAGVRPLVDAPGGAEALALAALGLGVVGYLTIEVANASTRSRAARARTLGRVGVVLCLGLSYSLAASTAATPLLLTSNDEGALLEVFSSSSVGPANTGAVALLALAFGILSQVFWHDKTVADPV